MTVGGLTGGRGARQLTCRVKACGFVGAPQPDDVQREVVTSALSSGETLLIWRFNSDNSSAVLALLRCFVWCIVINLVSQQFEAPHYSLPRLNGFWLRV